MITLTAGELIVALRVEEKAGRTAITEIIKIERCPSTYGFHAVIAGAPFTLEDME